MTFNSPLKEANLDNYDCTICGNTGYVLRTDENGYQWSRECECMKKRRSIRRLADSGLRDMVKRYTFEAYTTPTDKYRRIKEKALQFCITDAECFVIAGRTGSGKTHICTAICRWLAEHDWELRYFLWRTEATEIKTMITERTEYKKTINTLRNVPVLYIDDFFKGSVTQADVDLAFSILNDRYNGRGKKTIISTERTIEELIAIDEAVGGRIAERARGYAIKAPEENWRLKRPEPEPHTAPAEADVP